MSADPMPAAGDGALGAAGPSRASGRAERAGALGAAGPSGAPGGAEPGGASGVAGPSRAPGGAERAGALGAAGPSGARGGAEPGSAEPGSASGVAEPSRASGRAEPSRAPGKVPDVRTDEGAVRGGAKGTVRGGAEGAVRDFLGGGSPVGFGAASIGNLYREVSDEQAREALDAAWNGGIRYFDTAPHYGLGLSERRLGEFLREKPRDEFVLSTKVGRLLEPNPSFAGGRDLEYEFDVPDDLVRRFDPSEAGIRRSLEESLERLGLSRVDILYLHDPDFYDVDRGLREGLPALAELRDEGLVGRIGIGVNDAAVAARAVREGDLDLVMIAGRYTLLEQPALDELVPTCRERGVQLVAAAVFNSGLLARPEPATDARYDYATASSQLIERARAIARICAEYDVELPAAALQYPLRDPIVGSVVVGTADPGAVRQNLARVTVPIPDDMWSALAAAGFIPA